MFGSDKTEEVRLEEGRRDDEANQEPTQKEEGDEVIQRLKNLFAIFNGAWPEVIDAPKYLRHDVRDGGCWGHAVIFRTAPTTEPTGSQVHGWLWPKVQDGDEVIIRVSNEDHVFRLHNVNNMSDPVDMFFADAYHAGTLDQITPRPITYGFAWWPKRVRNGDRDLLWGGR